MPSRMVHYCIGFEILNIVRLNPELFIIGNLSPDAHDCSPYGVGASHFETSYRPGVDKYPVVALEEFRGKYLKGNFDDFTLGYYCHLITDNLWSKYVYYEYLQCDENERNMRVEKCYRDYYTLNKILIEEFNLRKVNLHIPEQVTIEEINAENLQRIIQELNNDFNSNYDNRDLTLLTWHFVRHFIRNAVDECIQEIKGLIERDRIVQVLTEHN